MAVFLNVWFKFQYDNTLSKRTFRHKFREILYLNSNMIILKAIDLSVTYFKLEIFKFQYDNT